jgi:hypothetical protein
MLQFVRSIPKNVMSGHRPRGRLFHNEQFAPFYGSVAFENAPNLHAGSRQVKMRKEMYKLQAYIFGESPVQFVSQNIKPDLQLTLEDESGTKDHEPMLKTC